MHKVGDEVLIKAKVVTVDKGDRLPYEVDTVNGCLLWIAEEEIIYDKTYTKGLEEAWAAAKRLYEMDDMERLNILNLGDYANIMEFVTPEEAIAKIEAYEKRNEVAPNKIVEDNEGTRALVLDGAGNGVFSVLTENGCVESWHKDGIVAIREKTIDVSELVKQIGER